MKTKDEMLWSLAKRRARFKKELFSYIVICSFLWAIWYVTDNHPHHYRNAPWPAWVMLGWGIGLWFSYAKAYLGYGCDSVDEEYQKLKQQS